MSDIFNVIKDFKPDFNPNRVYDAVGNEIELGRRYGYAANRNGFNTIIIGVAKNFSSTGVSLSVEQYKRGLSTQIPVQITEHKQTINVKPSLLFPIC